MSELEQAVVSTLAWFELSRQPLTTFECWHYLWAERRSLAATPSDVEHALHALAERGVVRAEEGFWCLSGGPARLSERRQRARFAITKRHLARRGARLIARVPFVRFVGLVNTVAYETPARDSDIDVFIVVTPGRLWFTRALATALVHLMGWRRHGRKVQDRLCLSFLVTERALGLQTLKLQDDPYLAYWVAGVLPLWGIRTYHEFMKANVWVGGKLPNRFTGVPLEVAESHGGAGVKRVIEAVFGGFLGTLLERMSKAVQVRRHRSHPNSRLWSGGTAVVVTDDVMKFHETDQRESLAKAFRRRLLELKVS